MNYSAQNLFPYLIVTFIYLAVAVDYWRIAKVPENTQLKLHSLMIALGLLVHAWLLHHSIFSAGFNLGFYQSISAILWLTVLIYWVTDRKYDLHSLQAFVLPPAALFALLPAFSVSNHYLPEAENRLFIAHIWIAMIAYSLFTFAALHALLMAIAERSLHHKSTLIKLPSFPPLMVMESLLFKIIGFGFMLLTVTLISGMWFSEDIFGQALQFNHKTVFSIMSWLIYAGLLFGRLKYGWRGRKAIRWTLTGFALLLLAYIGSQFVLQILLGK
ncbi:MAG: cytochrome C biogenesis protein [Betaproteobacteria bacterium HGW-Betaproteobacteria-22]|nr:MAG: cytochrome C biogenesis protein [Betaproteobacteria bacterium HGW-Betaproteobacteria-22]